jgi:hypothetical protein
MAAKGADSLVGTLPIIVPDRRTELKGANLWFRRARAFTSKPTCARRINTLDRTLTRSDEAGCSGWEIRCNTCTTPGHRRGLGCYSPPASVQVSPALRIASNHTPANQCMKKKAIPPSGVC